MSRRCWTAHHNGDRYRVVRSGSGWAVLNNRAGSWIVLAELLKIVHSVHEDGETKLRAELARLQQGAQMKDDRTTRWHTERGKLTSLCGHPRRSLSGHCKSSVPTIAKDKNRGKDRQGHLLHAQLLGHRLQLAEMRPHPVGKLRGAFFLLPPETLSLNADSQRRLGGCRHIQMQPWQIMR
jgi:hypothetical protein